MTIAERILETLQDLAPEQQAEVLDFAAFFRTRARAAQPPADREPPPLPVLEGRVPAGWTDAIYEPR
jgi:hypothetical protein